MGDSSLESQVELTEIQKWVAVQQNVTDTAKTNRIQNLGSTVVSPTQKSEFSISETKRLVLWPSQSTLSWYLMNMNRLVQKLWKLLELVPTNMTKSVGKDMFHMRI